MSRIIKSVAFLFITIAFVACQQTEQKKEIEKEIQVNAEEVADLKVKLNATEAQLLNIQVELAKCKGDSLAIDSLTHATNKK
jgi:hypothetical protein